MPRLSEVSRAQASEEMVALYDQWFGEGRDPVADPGTRTGTPGNWWTVWAHAPEVLRALRGYSYTAAPFDPKLRELALIRVGYTRGSQFVFSQHCKAARNVGVEEAKIRAVPCWTLSDALTPVERAVLAYVDAMILEGGRVHDDVFTALRQAFSEREILVLTYLVMLYNTYGTASKALRLEFDDVPERIVEIPTPEDGGVQDWQDPKSWTPAKTGLVEEA